MRGNSMARKLDEKELVSFEENLWTSPCLCLCGWGQFQSGAGQGGAKSLLHQIWIK